MDLRLTRSSGAAHVAWVLSDRGMGINGEVTEPIDVDLTGVRRVVVAGIGG